MFNGFSKATLLHTHPEHISHLVERGTLMKDDESAWAAVLRNKKTASEQKLKTMRLSSVMHCQTKPVQVVQSDMAVLW